MKTLFIVNPISGRDSLAALKRRLLDIVDHLPDSHAAVPTNSQDAYSLAQYAVQSGYDRIVVAGGDGTINQVVNGISDSGAALGIIPMGTGNVLAYDIGLVPNDIDQALAVIEANVVRQADLGQANGWRFLLMAGFGFDAEVVGCVSPRYKALFGRLAYAPVILKQFLICRPAEFRLAMDDCSSHVTQAYTVVVSNCSSYAYNFKIAPGATFDDGLLDVHVFESTMGMKGRFLFWLASTLFTRRIMDFHATHFQVRHVRVDSNPSVRMQLDGDVHGKAGVDIRVLPKALRLIVP